MVLFIEMEQETVRILKEFNGEFCLIKLRSDAILQVNTIANVEYGPNEAAIVIQNILAIADNKEQYILVVSGEYANVTVESMKLLSSPIAMSYAIAKAYVINSISQRIMANFYLNVIKPEKPVQFFQNQSEAEFWLKSLIESDKVEK